MPDFTFHTFRVLLTSLKAQNYTFQTFAQFLKDPAPRAIILRHDVDLRIANSLRIAQLENELGIAGTYNFRIISKSYDEEIIRKINTLGHEIGYHYEDLAITVKAYKGQGTPAYAEASSGKRDKGHRPTLKLRRVKGTREEMIYKEAIQSFEKNLEVLRSIVPIETICMHGSPLSKYDNQKIWERYDYRDYGIIGEPYFDVDFGRVLYLTDTGRRWDEERVSVRDKIEEGRWKKEDNSYSEGRFLRKIKEGRFKIQEGRFKKGQGTPAYAEASSGKRDKGQGVSYHSTFDIIRAANNGELPVQIMLTVHPQRWDDKPLPWIRELIIQNIKNVGKRIVVGWQ